MCNESSLTVTQPNNPKTTAKSVRGVWRVLCTIDPLLANAFLPHRAAVVPRAAETTPGFAPPRRSERALFRCGRRGDGTPGTRASLQRARLGCVLSPLPTFVTSACSPLPLAVGPPGTSTQRALHTTLCARPPAHTVSLLADSCAQRCVTATCPLSRCAESRGAVHAHTFFPSRRAPSRVCACVGVLPEWLCRSARCLFTV